MSLEGPERDEAFELLLRALRVGALIGYRFRLEGWTMRIIRPDGSVAMEVTASTPEHLAELKTLAQTTTAPGRT